ncbi:SCO family protein [Leptospira sp. 2 VSF19]|uniref:SCO family protein n=1 Tax=Leptospira soteropolitanensis TaxID=2950025 RepID=A0AAW5VRA9_9LEPT|nr:SCO family protein [Leptospira soteropolitanensis]MCW7494569.1 SCO family protein [Leptospira soteropolitanensis]MCW7502163.1 SCO family protein [Leptospira soteropolitanensis]MCW7524407.1 SCO family protein [Leptospira soteropolitanensis]MCW7528273.1 SCO family protein [Leptospira soteropolitanensis]MCW7532133.1 SCO family protein [Leptospira soteropolitanensis]
MIIPKHSNIYIFLILIIFFSCGWFQREDGEKDSKLTFFDTPKKDKLPYYRGRDLEAFWVDKNLEPNSVRKVDPFVFQNQLGQNIDESHFKGKITVVSFFFARCHGLCPSIIRNLKFVQSEIAKSKNIQIVSYSVTPDLDTSPELKKFAEEKGIYSKYWNLLTGDREKIFEVARNTFQADTNTTNKNPTKDFVHSEQIFLIDPNLNFRGVYNGNRSESIKTMLDDIELLVGEFSLNH